MGSRFVTKTRRINTSKFDIRYLIVFMVLFISVGFAALAANLQITGAVTVHGAEFDVVFEPEGGSMGTATSTMKILLYGTKGDLPTPTKNGYNFGGWYSSANGQGAKYSKYEDINSNVTLYANWNIVTYTITYTLNSGSIVNNATSYSVDTADFTLPIPTRSGYVFTGWTGSNGTTAQTSVTVKKGSTGNLAYTANWSACTACAAGTGATCSMSVSNNTCTYSTSCKTGYQTITNNGKYNPSCTATSYTISYTLNSGSISGQKTSYTIETPTFTLPIPTRSGNVFTGWTGSNGSTAQTSVSIAQGSTGNKSYTANWSACTACAAGTGANCTMSVSNNTCTYATSCKTGYQTITNNGKYNPSCTAISYTITYTLNSGSISGQKTSYTIETASFTLPIPTRSGNVFTGWTGSNGSTKQTSVTIAKGSTGNKAYTANWSACTACAPGTGANCSLSVVNNTCTYTTSCKSGYGNITNNGKYNPSCKALSYAATRTTAAYNYKTENYECNCRDESFWYCGNQGYDSSGNWICINDDWREGTNRKCDTCERQVKNGCPTGYTDSGSDCYKYTCPNGGTLSGTTCVF